MLAKGAVLAGGVALVLRPLLALPGTSRLDVVLAALAVYAMDLELYV